MCVRSAANMAAQEMCRRHFTVLCQLFNWSLEHDSVPSSFKCAYITPLLKKADLDPTLSPTGRSRTCLSFPSCLSGSIVSSQLVKYLKGNDLLPDLQSAYRAMHSTETAVLKVLADILLALDSGELAMLTLLCLPRSTASTTTRY